LRLDLYAKKFRMRTYDNIKETFNNLIINVLHTTLLNITLLPASGSSRKYYRLTTGNGSYIGTYNQNIEENSAFLSFSKHFLECQLPVPHIFAVSEDKDIYIQSDFGDYTLFNSIERCLKSGYDEETIGIYKKSLNYLIDFQIVGHNNLDYSKAFPTSGFDRMSILGDLNYFKYCFLKINEEIQFNETRLDLDFQKLTDFLSEAPSDFFMYRDFQSRNIMVRDGEPYFIDYQGGRKGPLQYDVISLLYQVKACIPEEIREDLLKHYLLELERKSKGTISVTEFLKYYPAFILLRLLQVLGAYGFRGLIQNKLHFIQSIPFAIKELLHQVEKWQIPCELAELQSVIRQLVIVLPKFEHTESEVLTVVINSFSFKNGGIPKDNTGNGGGFVFDCRALPNPGRYAQYNDSTGENDDVKEFMDSHPETHFFMQNVQMLVFQSIDNYLERGFKNLQINFGCTGGQHRSIYFAQKTAETIHGNYPMVNVIVNHVVQHKNHVYEAK